MIGLDGGDEEFEIFAELSVLFAEVGEVFGFVFGFGNACFVFDAGDYASLGHFLNFGVLVYDVSLGGNDTRCD